MSILLVTFYCVGTSVEVRTHKKLAGGRPLPPHAVDKLYVIVHKSTVKQNLRCYLHQREQRIVLTGYKLVPVELDPVLYDSWLL
jgi:hypothetical protein